MKAEQILFSQGFGTRHECQGLILLGKFTAAGTLVEDPDEDIDTRDLVFTRLTALLGLTTRKPS